MLAIRVAEAADAWFKDPHDTKAYSDFASALRQFQAYRHPQLPVGAGEDELLDELADQSPPEPVGALLRGASRQQIMGELRRHL